MFDRLLNTRLSHIYPALFLGFFAFIWLYHKQPLTPGQLALFSSNTFLFGYYFGPMLNGQKARVDSLTRAARQEAMIILDILAQSHLLKPKERHDLKLRLRVYLDSIIGSLSVRADNPYYDELLRFTKSQRFAGNSIMDVIYGRLAKTQEDRDSMQSALENKPYSHEWLVVCALFFITLYFILQIDYGNSLFFSLILAVLCTGVSLLMVILIKYASLTHKQAKRVWHPLMDLRKNHFEDISHGEAMVMKREIDSAS